MLTCMKDWDQGARREQHASKDVDLEEAFKNLFLDEEGEGNGSGSGIGIGSGGSTAGGEVKYCCCLI